MNPKSASIAPSSLLCISFFILFSSATCFDITNILSTYPQYSTFNRYLTRTNIAEEINKRQTITVLAVANSVLSNSPDLTMDELKKVMSLHIVLDFYDVPKLQKLSKKSALLTTLFQSSGQALGQQGFINVTVLSSGDIAFGSAVKGSILNANLTKFVMSQPYNISILQINGLIIPEGLSAVAPAAALSKLSTPVPSKAPSPADDSSAPTATDAPAAADSPLTPPPMSVDRPAVDTPAPAPAPEGSGSTRVGLGLLGAVFMMFVSSLAAL